VQLMYIARSPVKSGFSITDAVPGVVTGRA
jgi:hypothetical protein